MVPDEKEVVLVGAATLAAYGAKVYPSLEVACKEMGSGSQVIYPRAETRDYHERKYKVFREMLNDQLKYKVIMNDIAPVKTD